MLQLATASNFAVCDVLLDQVKETKESIENNEQKMDLFKNYFLHGIGETYILHNYILQTVSIVINLKFFWHSINLVH